MTNKMDSEMRLLADLGLPAVTEKPRWINVNDAMPENHQEVFVCTKNKRILKARWSADWNKFMGPGVANVTYWMELPELPEVEA